MTFFPGHITVARVCSGGAPAERDHRETTTKPPERAEGEADQ